MISSRAIEQDVVILDLPGMVDSESLQNTIQSTLSGGQLKVVLNISKITFIESSGLGSLVAAHKTIESKGGKMAIFGVQPYVQKLVDITKLDRILKIFGNEQDALDYIQ